MRSRQRSIRYDVTWRRGNLFAVVAWLTVAGFLLAWRGGLRSCRFADAPPLDPRRVLAATEKIDPNTATLGSLRRLPGLGPVKAQSVVDYRQTHGPCLRHPEDIEAVNGIGPGIVQRIRPYLSLPSKEP